MGRLTVENISIPLVNERINDPPVLLLPIQRDNRSLSLIFLGDHPDTRRRVQGVRPGVFQPRPDPDRPPRRQKGQGVSESEEDAVDESPLFGFDPLVVSMVVGKVEQRVQG